MNKILIAVGALVVIYGIGYLSFFVKKNINYNMMYKNMVKETIQENVKSECLK